MVLILSFIIIIVINILIIRSPKQNLPQPNHDIEKYNNNSISYIVTTLCIGKKFEKIRPHWEKRVNQMTTNSLIKIFDNSNINKKDDAFKNINYEKYAWWDILRLKNNIVLVEQYNKPVIHCDLDLILEKNITEIVNLPYEFIISQEHYGNEAMPINCSSILGFGVCTGFYIIKPSSLPFIKQIFNMMKNEYYDSYSDQITISNYIRENIEKTYKETIYLNNMIFENNIIKFKNSDIKICVLDFNLITRDPKVSGNQYGNHINITNAGSVENFIKFFYNKVENLPDITKKY
jgi:hypothetical protein